MNTGQMMMALMALVLLAGVSVSVNSMMASKNTTMLEVEANLNAISLGQSMLDEVLSQDYDLATVGGAKIYDAGSFTATSGLGPSALEVSRVLLPDSLVLPGPLQMPSVDSAYKSNQYYNDVDDYNGYKRVAFTSTMTNFYIIDTVYYVSESNPDVKSSPQTFYKKVVVTIRHRSMCPPGVSFNAWTGKYFLQLSDVAVYRRYF